MSQEYRVTTAGVSAAEDRSHRMRMYFISMALRVLCVLSLFWVHGWWILVPAVGAVVLPWFAVMVGNAVAHNNGEAVEAPEPLALTSFDPLPADADTAAAGDSFSASNEVIVFDVDPVRRSQGDSSATEEPSA